MGLEDPTYISDLNSSWPLGTDKRREGDDHFRALKRAIKNTFPNINQVVTASAALLNSIPEAGVSAIVTEIIKNLPPLGIIVMWSGNYASIPVGWTLCNGTIVPGFGTTPNLTDRFIIAAGATFSPGAIGGALASDAGGEHIHTSTATALTIAQLPPHTHSQQIYSVAVGTSNIADGVVTNGVLWTNQETGFAGDGEAHSHDVEVAGSHIHTLPLQPYFALAFIQKTSPYVTPPPIP